MFDETPEYSNDLEWMLQSGQAKDDEIVAALVSEYYPRVYRLQFSICGDRPGARRLAVDTLANALLNAHHYTDSEGVQVWLERLAVEQAQRQLLAANRPTTAEGARQALGAETGNGLGPDSDALWQGYLLLEERSRLPLALRCLHSLSESEAAQRLKISEVAVAERIEQARSELLQRLSEAYGEEIGWGPEELESRLAASLQRSWAMQEPPGREIEESLRAVRLRVSEMKRARRKRVLLQEAILVGIAILVVLALVRIAGSILARPGPNRPLPENPAWQAPPLRAPAATLAASPPGGGKDSVLVVAPGVIVLLGLARRGWQDADFRAEDGFRLASLEELEGDDLAGVRARAVAVQAVGELFQDQAAQLVPAEVGVELSGKVAGHFERDEDAPAGKVGHAVDAGARKGRAGIGDEGGDESRRAGAGFRQDLGRGRG